MYSPSSISRDHILAVVAINLLFIRSVFSLNMTNAYLQHKCFDKQGKYKPGSEYEKDLASIIRSIDKPGKLSPGFVIEGSGKGSSFVSVVLQCRGDSYGPKCSSCYATALSGLRRKCPRYKGGIIWYDQCLLEFSSVDTVWQNDYDKSVSMSNPKNVSGDRLMFNSLWTKLLSNLTEIAITKDYNDPTVLYAAGEAKFGTKILYGMVQCTRDVGKKGCQECFSFYLVRFYDDCAGKQGARVLGRTCSFRFEFYPFVSSTKSDLKYLKM